MAHVFSLIIDSVSVTGESLPAVALPGLIRQCREPHHELRIMSTVLIEIRRANASDAAAIADAHDEAWRTAYQGIIPGAELRRLINRRGPAWWDSAIRKGSRIALLQFGDKIAGYANYGRNRSRSLYYDGEIYELYLRPEYQGLGFGRRLFTAARRDLAQSALKSLIVWALSESENAVKFYRALGGKPVARSSEKFGARVLDKVAFGWAGSDHD
jgi:ribosomal protein S18 acetylase RimI-like enzyme